MHPSFRIVDPVAIKPVAYLSERVQPQRNISILKTSGLRLQDLLPRHEGRDSCPRSGGFKALMLKARLVRVRFNEMRVSHAP